MEFSDLTSLYEHLDQHAQDYSISFTIGQLFNQLANSLKTSGNEIDAEKAQWETTFFFVMFSDGKSKPFSEAYNDKGECIRYPDFKKIEEKQWSYLIERFDTVTNPVLKANYAHILWCSPKKHGNYAQIAVDNYLLLVKIFEQKDRECPTEHFGLKALDCLKQAYFLANIINYRFEGIKAEIQRLMTSYYSESSSCPSLRTQLIALVIEDKKIFVKEDLTTFDTLCDEVAGIWISRNNPHAAISVYELAERWEMKFSGNNSGVWRRKIAESYESMMQNQLKNKNYGVAISFCIDSISSYKILKDEEKIEELEKIYQENKTKIKYAEISVPFDPKPAIEFSNDLAKKIVAHSPEEIICFLASDDAVLLPKIQIVTDRAKEINKTSLAHQLFPITATDQQSNPAQTFGSDAARLDHSVLEQYRLELELSKRFVIQEIIFTAIREGKLTIRDIVDFLKQHSWAGKVYSKTIGNQEISYSWVSQIAPAIDEYFNQISLYYLNNENVPNLILCIDSLTLKIEGLFRDLCKINGIPISSVKQDGIVREKLLNELLDEPNIQELFSDDEMRFFKLVLIEQSGYNLRHRIAHSLMIFPEYSIDHMNYLIVIMLRICKFNFTVEPATDVNASVGKSSK